MNRALRAVVGTGSVLASGVTGTVAISSIENIKGAQRYAEGLCKTPDHIPLDCTMARGTMMGFGGFTGLLFVVALALFVQGIVLYLPKRGR